MIITTTKFNILGMEAIKELIASFRPGFFDINLNGLSTLKILKTLILAKVLTDTRPTTEKHTIAKSL